MSGEAPASRSRLKLGNGAGTVERTQIPKDRYTSPEYLRAEFEAMWPRVWLAAGPSADLPQPGSYFTFELGTDSVLVVRQPEGVLAFHNVCRHRGRRLREPGLGRAQSFQCAYHAWEWKTDGCLKCVPDVETFPQGVPASDFSLKPVAATEWAGLVWVSFAANPPPLLEFLGPVAPLIEAYRLEDYALVEDQTMDLACNWKAAVDAFNEGYHLTSVHPELLDILDDSGLCIDLYGDHSRLTVPFFVPSPSHPHREEMNAGLKWMMEEAGVPPSQLTGSPLELRRKLQEIIRGRERAGELDCRLLTDDQLTDNHQFYVFPNLTLNIYSLKLMLMRHRPHPTDPNRMLFDQQQYVRVGKGQARPRRPAHAQFAFGAGSLGKVTDQDMFNLIRVQQGLRSTGFEWLTLGDHELRIRHMHQTLDRYLAPTG